MVKDKSKIKMVLSVIALSMAMGFNAEYVDFPLHSTPVNSSTHFYTGTYSVRTYGDVKEESIVRARQLLDSNLSEGVKQIFSSRDVLTIIAGNNMEAYARYQLNLDNPQVGDKVSTDNKGVSIYCAEGMLDDYLPQIAKSVNNYYQLA